MGAHSSSAPREPSVAWESTHIDNGETERTIFSRQSAIGLNFENGEKVTSFPVRRATQFVVLRRIGSGAFSNVFEVNRETMSDEGEWVSDGKRFALKIFKDDDRRFDGFSEAQHETRILKSLGEVQNMCEMVACFVETGTLNAGPGDDFDEDSGDDLEYILIELVNKATSITDLLEPIYTTASANMKTLILRNLMKKVEMLHGAGVAHRDLHTGNVMITNPQMPDIVFDAFVVRFNQFFKGIGVYDELIQFYPFGLLDEEKENGVIPLILERYLGIFGRLKDDVKVANVLEFLSFEEEHVAFDLRIIDFGKAVFLDRNVEEPPIVVSDPRWYYPTANFISGPKTDVYQIGLIAFLLVYGRVPMMRGVPESAYERVFFADNLPEPFFIPEAWNQIANTFGIPRNEIGWRELFQKENILQAMEKSNPVITFWDVFFFWSKYHTGFFSFPREFSWLNSALSMELADRPSIRELQDASVTAFF